MTNPEWVEEEEFSAEGEVQTEPAKQDADLLPPGCGMWFAWLFTSTIGMGLGWVLGWQLSFLIPGVFSTVMLGAAVGLILGALQWPVLRIQFQNSGLWILHTAAGWGVGFALGVFIVQSFGLIDWLFGLVLGVIVGAVVGISQWLFLARRTPKAGWWVPVSVFSLASGLVYYRAEAPWLGLLIGALYGIVTGVALVWMLFGPEKEGLQ
jgi:hypothetical protein